MKNITKQELIEFEKRIARRYDDGDFPYLVHLCGGNEDRLIEIFEDAKPGDWFFSTHRSHYHYLLAGGSPERLEYLIEDGRSMFVFDSKLNFYTSSIVCAVPSIAAGVAWALKRSGSENRVWCFVGDGAEDEGHFCEAVRYVDGWDLPCTFIIEDNDRSVSASKAVRWGTDRVPSWPSCVVRYSYKPTWPHGGTGTPGWLNFKREPKVKTLSPKLDAPFPTNLAKTDLSYKGAVKFSMEKLAEDEKAIFVGYNVRYGSAYGSLADVPEDQRLETPLAENLMAGLCMGMSLVGYRPVLFFERHDFVHNAMDAICNQMNLIHDISEGEFHLPVVIKAVAGSAKPFYAGLTHTSNLSFLFRNMFNFPVFVPRTPEEVLYSYKMCSAGMRTPMMVCEDKGLY